MWVAGLQAILPDAILMAVAAARPSSPSALIAHANETLRKLNRDASQRDAFDALPQSVPACLCQQSEKVCAHSTADSGVLICYSAYPCAYLPCLYVLSVIVLMCLHIHICCSCAIYCSDTSPAAWFCVTYGT